MKVATFKQEVEKERLRQASAAIVWRWGDESKTNVRIVSKTLAIQSYKNERLSTTLLDSAASVHVFNSKDRFSNFRRPARRQKLKCGGGIMPIKGWGEVSLPMKVGNRTSILMLRNIAYVSNFPLNLILLRTLERKGFKWQHWSGKIQNNKELIIGFTVRQGTNYEIGENLDTAMTTLAMTSRLRPGYMVKEPRKKEKTIS